MSGGIVSRSSVSIRSLTSLDASSHGVFVDQYIRMSSNQNDCVSLSKAALVIFLVSIIVTITLVIISFTVSGSSSGMRLALLSSAGGIGLITSVALIIYIFTIYCRSCVRTSLSHSSFSKE